MYFAWQGLLYNLHGPSIPFILYSFSIVLFLGFYEKKKAYLQEKTKTYASLTGFICRLSFESLVSKDFLRLILSRIEFCSECTNLNSEKIKGS